MTKLKMGAKAIVYPNPVVLIGALVDGRPNYCLVGDCALAGVRWPLVMVSLHEEHWTTRGVLTERAFSVNIPSFDLLEAVDACGQVSGREVDCRSWRRCHALEG
jgi:flavin reductase (DIM6/NTAB) family NADH-FMN oxidoreductase RutF